LKISVIGTGYVGLVTGACFSDMGNDVICMDIDGSKISDLKKGIIPIYEPGLEEIIARNIKDDRLTFTTHLKEAVDNSKIIFIAVGTPPDEDGSADVSHVIECSRKVAGMAKDNKVLIIKSTVPIGTCDLVEREVRAILKENNARFPIDIVSNPEFLKEGSAVEDFMKPDRVIAGVSTERAGESIKELYMPFTRNGHPVLILDRKSSEMIKYASNAMLALRISFMNEIASLCREEGADVEKVRVGIGLDKRIGSAFLYSGLGYGGSCFPKDVKALISIYETMGMESRILKAVEHVNNRQKTWPVEVLKKVWKDGFSSKKVAIWGLSFKPNTDDIREAPSVVIIKNLLELGARVSAHDPIAVENIKRLFPGDAIKYSEHYMDTLKNSDALIVVTEWGLYRNPDLEKMKSMMRNPLVIDGRNLFDPALFRKEGFQYHGVGRS